MSEPYYVSVLGDSISTLIGYTQEESAFYHPAYARNTGVASAADTWWMQCISTLHGNLLVNNSHSGSTLCMGGFQPAAAPWRLERLKKATVLPNLILIFTGLNDVAFGADPAVFAAQYDSMLETLGTLYPDADVCCATLCYGALPSIDTLPFADFSHAPPLTAYNEGIRAAVQKHGAMLADLEAAGLVYASIDGAHPNRDGMCEISAVFIQAIGGLAQG